MDAWQPFIDGAVGGAVLGLLRVFISTADLVRTMEYGQRKSLNFLISSLLAITILSLIGGAVAWAFTGRSGSFITGLTSLGLLLLIIGQSAIVSNSNEIELEDGK